MVKYGTSQAMKYSFLRQFLRILIYIKRFFWWIGSGIYFVLNKFWYIVVFFKYKIGFFLKKRGVGDLRGIFLKRHFLEIVFLAALLLIIFPQSKLYASKNLGFPGQNTIAYKLVGGEVEGFSEEIGYSEAGSDIKSSNSWRQAVLNPAFFNSSPAATVGDLSSIIPGGLAIVKPQIMPGINTIFTRNSVESYTVEPGDSLGTIAADFRVSVATILWENGLTTKSLIRPGDVLRIPPTTGVMHTVKRGDTLQKIASLYSAKTSDIIEFNGLNEDGSNLKSGQKIMVPNGIKAEQRAVASIRRTDASVSRIAIPPASRQAPSAGGFIWPSGAHNITQYFGFRHPALDIAGPFGTPTYASKAGIVEKAACGWNYGYGCYVVIDHGGGFKTLYGHHSKLLVSPGDRVEAGQTIALMGNTGNVRGKTGIHVHFEIIVNGARVNPLGYVR
jgi:LysM repeat protein